MATNGSMDTTPADITDSPKYKDKVGYYYIKQDAFNPSFDVKTKKIKEKLRRYTGFYDEPRVEGLSYVFNFTKDERDKIGLCDNKLDEEKAATEFFKLLEEKRYCSFHLLERYTIELGLHCPKEINMQIGFFMKFKIDILDHVTQDWRTLDEEYGKEIEMLIKQQEPDIKTSTTPLCQFLEARKLLVKLNQRIDFNSDDWKKVKRTLIELDTCYDENLLMSKRLELESCTSFIKLVELLEQRKLLDWDKVCGALTKYRLKEVADELNHFFR